MKKKDTNEKMPHDSSGRRGLSLLFTLKIVCCQQINPASDLWLEFGVRSARSGSRYVPACSQRASGCVILLFQLKS